MNTKCHLMKNNNNVDMTLLHSHDAKLMGSAIKQNESEAMYIEYRSDDVTKYILWISAFEYHILIEHDEKPPQPKFGGNRLMGARDMTA